MTEQTLCETELLNSLAQTRQESAVSDSSLFPALLRLAKFYFDAHRYSEVRPLLEEALSLRLAICGETHPLTAESLTQLATLEAALHEHVKAIALLRRALLIVEPLSHERMPQLVTILNQLVESLFAECYFSEAMDHCRHALELQGGNIHSVTPEMIRTRNNLAALHVARGEYYLAARLLKLNAQILRTEGSNNDLAVSTALNNLAEVFRLQGQLPDAWKQAVKALWSRRRAVGRTHPMVAQSWANLAAIRFDEGRYRAAESLFRRALAIRRAHAETHPASLAATLRSLAEVVSSSGRTYEAETIYQQAIGLYEKTFGPHDPQLALTLTFLGRLHTECGQHGNAQQVLARAVEIQDRRMGARDAAIAYTNNTYGSLLAARGNHELADTYFRRALDVQKSVLGGEHPDVAATLILIGDVAVTRGDHQSAECAYRKALDIRRKQLGEGHKLVAESLHRLAKLMVLDGEPQRAIELCSVIRRKHTRHLELNSQLHADTLGTLADALFLQDELGEAESLSLQELELRTPHQAARPGESLPAFRRLTKLYLKRQQLDQALESAQQLVTLAERLFGANHPNMIAAIEEFAEVQIARGDEQADATVARAMKLRERKFGTDSDEVTSAFENFANLFHSAGQVRLADEYFTRASNLRDRHSHALFV